MITVPFSNFPGASSPVGPLVDSNGPTRDLCGGPWAVQRASPLEVCCANYLTPENNGDSMGHNICSDEKNT